MPIATKNNSITAASYRCYINQMDTLKNYYKEGTRRNKVSLMRRTCDLKKKIVVVAGSST